MAVNQKLTDSEFIKKSQTFLEEESVDYKWHGAQKEVPGMDAKKMQRFFDAPAKVLLDKTNEIIDEMDLMGNSLMEKTNEIIDEMGLMGNSLSTYGTQIDKNVESISSVTQSIEEIKESSQEFYKRVDTWAGEKNEEISKNTDAIEENADKIEKLSAELQSKVTTGSECVQGQMAYKIVSIAPSSKCYVLDSSEGLAVGMRVSITLVNNYDDCGTIAGLGGKTIWLAKDENGVQAFPFEAGKDADENGNLYADGDNILRVLDDASLGTHRVGETAVALGVETKALMDGAFASGAENEAHGKWSTAVGKDNRANYCATAIGRENYAKGKMSFAAGEETEASGVASSTDGYQTKAKGWLSRAIGWLTEAIGQWSFAIGRETKAIADGSFAGGRGTRASAVNQTVLGQFNEEMAEALFIVGNGESDSKRSNAFWVKKDGTTSLDSVEHIEINTYDLTMEQIRLIERECIQNDKPLVISMNGMRYVCTQVYYPVEGALAFVFVNYAYTGEVTINRHRYDLSTGAHDYNAYTLQAKGESQAPSEFATLYEGGNQYSLQQRLEIDCGAGCREARGTVQIFRGEDAFYYTDGGVFLKINDSVINISAVTYDITAYTNEQTMMDIVCKGQYALVSFYHEKMEDLPFNKEKYRAEPVYFVVPLGDDKINSLSLYHQGGTIEGTTQNVGVSVVGKIEGRA